MWLSGLKSFKQTSAFSSGHDLSVLELSPALGFLLSREPASLPLSLPASLPASLPTCDLCLSNE